MKFLLSILILAAVFKQYSSEQGLFVYGDRPCGTNISNLWLDIVVLVDNSEATTENGLKNIVFYITGIFNNNISYGSNPNNPKTVRLGLVTYNEETNVVADLDKIQSYDDLYDVIYGDKLSISASDKSYLDRGLLKAYSLLQTQDVHRKHYQKVIIVFSSTYNGSDDSNPLKVADRFKNEGITIITVGYDKRQDKDQRYLDKLGKIATPGFNFTTKELMGTLIKKVQVALTQANCYCPPPFWLWSQFRETDSLSRTIRYGVCVQLYTSLSETTWRDAHDMCRDSRDNTLQMVTEYSESKHNFVIELMTKNRYMNLLIRIPYHIGLHLENGTWKWPNTNLRDWYGWNEGFPINDTSMSAVINNLNENGTVGWENVNIDRDLAYPVCEMAACDTDNYCEF